MSIELHVVEKTQAGVKGGGKVKYSVNTTVRMPIREREFIDNLSKNYNIGTPDIIRVLYATAEEVLNQLELGTSPKASTLYACFGLPETLRTCWEVSKIFPTGTVTSLST